MTNSVANSKEKESSVRLVRSGRLPVEQLARVQIPYGAPRNLALRKRSFLKDLNQYRVILHQKQIGNLKKVENILWLQHTTKGAYQVIPKNEIKDIGR